MTANTWKQQKYYQITGINNFTAVVYVFMGALQIVAI